MGTSKKNGMQEMIKSRQHIDISLLYARKNQSEVEKNKEGELGKKQETKFPRRR